MKFVRFREYCDWEGETWTFWLQKDGNEESLKALQKKLESEEDVYHCEFDVEINEDQVDTLVKYGGQGYLNYHNKVSGTLTKQAVDAIMVGDEDTTNLYKGGIASFFEAEEPNLDNDDDELHD